MKASLRFLSLRSDKWLITSSYFLISVIEKEKSLVLEGNSETDWYLIKLIWSKLDSESSNICLGSLSIDISV